MRYSLNEIVEITGGNLLQGDPDLVVSGAATDSRVQLKGLLFCALAGARADGHDFLDEVSQRGASAALIERPVSVSSSAFGLIMVDSTAKALGAIAARYRAALSVTVIGITGSVGKTSTKDLAGSVIGRKFATYKNPGNLNSHIGLPLAVFGIKQQHEYAVLEMAMRAKGEISELCGIAKPRIGVLTDISSSHIGVLGSLSAIASAKAELLENLPSDGCAILCWDNEMVRKMRHLARCPVITYGFSEDADCWGHDVDLIDGTRSQFKVRYLDQDYSFFLNLPGSHQVQNALGVIALGFNLGLTAEEISDGLKNAEMSPMRQEVIEVGGFTVINDAYNASVKSMKAALDLLSDAAKSRKIAILGDILEMGDLGPKAHFEIGAYAYKKADVLVAIGPQGIHFKEGWDSCGSLASLSSSWFSDKEEAKNFIKGLIKQGDTCLLKASRGMEFESLADFLKDLNNCGIGDENN